MVGTVDSARYWDRAARRYAASPVADPAGYERTLERTRALLQPSDRVLELGCGSGTTALRLAGSVRDYLATDISAGMIATAEERYAAAPMPGLAFRVATAEAVAPGAEPFDAVLGFNYLHLVQDLPGTLRRIHALLAPEGLFISKTPCVGEMNALIRLGLLPAMRLIGLAPHAGVFTQAELDRRISAAGFEVIANENHAGKGNDHRPYVVARKR